MSTLKWYKAKIKSGDIISFRYGNKRRNVIVMECPNDDGRAGKFTSKTGKLKKFLHGLEIPLNDKYDALVDRIIKKLGGTRLLTEFQGQEYYQINFGNELRDLMNARAAYEKIKPDISEIGIYKTYDWSKIRSISLNNSVADFESLVNAKYKIEDK